MTILSLILHHHERNRYVLYSDMKCPEDKRNTSGAYQGAKYFTYNGEILDDIRTRLEEL